MAYLDPREATKDLRNGVVEGIKSHFPLQGRVASIHLESVDVDENKADPEDVEGQYHAKVNGKTWATPVIATLALKDNETGKVLERRRMKVADLPAMTKRYTYLIDGQEHQVDNQWQLKPGVYTRRRQSGVLEAQFNVPSRRSFDVTFDPEKKLFHMSRGSSEKIPLYPLMKELGVDDDTLEKTWGREILNANRVTGKGEPAINKFFKADRHRAPKDLEEARAHFHESLTESKLRPEATEITLGKAFHHVDGNVLSSATKKILSVQGGAPEDERDSLVFKNLRTTGDYAKDKLSSWNVKKTVGLKVRRQINKPGAGLRDIIPTDLFNDQVRHTFRDNSLVREAGQVNPVEMMASSFQTSIMGPGGIQSEDAIMEEAKLISPSHMGFLDPMRTPEGSKTGITLRLPLAVRKEGESPTIPVYNLRSNKMERINPKKFYDSKVVMPDQIRWQGGKPVPVNKTVQMSIKGNDVHTGDFASADYTLTDPSQLFSMTSNLVPFMGNNSGNRVTYATQHIEQAISLKKREVPLVQVGTGKAGETFESFIGKNSAHRAPVTGTVTRVEGRAVHVKDSSGVSHKVGLYNNFPLNDQKSVLHSTPVVKVGDKVTAGSVVADNNFTQDGKLALGVNLRVGYVPLKGYNFEDGVVVSESAADKLTSVHMHKPDVSVGDAITEARKYKIFHPTAFNKDQFSKVGDDGVVRVGARVMPGDPLVLATKPYELRNPGSIAQVRKSMTSQHTDGSLVWKSDYPGEVVGVHRDKAGKVTVHVRTEEKLQVGDKIAGRHGNKGIVTAVLPDKEMPHTADGKHIEVALNPSGIPGRMNIGQVLETAVGKVAEKTGQPFVVHNFEHGVDQLDRVKGLLKKHGLQDQEELFDPASGKSLGKALVGPQHTIKLLHQIDKKVSARAGNVLEGGEPEHYDVNLIPSGGGKTGAQSIGNLGLYAMLAHGATANIREMQTWKSEGEDPRGKWHSAHNQVWRAIQTGDTIPTPKKTFAFQKFEDMLRAAAINVDKKGHNIQLMPMTNAQVLAMSAGEVKDPSKVVLSKADRFGEPIPEKGGIFDPHLTGGHGGLKWTHMTLAEPMPNPVFEGAIQKVLGMSVNDYNKVVGGDRAVDKKTGKLVDVGAPNSIAGGAAIAHKLEQIDVGKELAATKSQLDKMKIDGSIAHRESTVKLDSLYKKVRYLDTLHSAGITAKDAYVIEHLPIIPPAMRPARFLPDGNLNEADLNGLYKQLGALNTKMKSADLVKKYGGDAAMKEERAGLYDGLSALMGVGQSWSERKKLDKGILLQIAGESPKQGYFQGTLLKRRQDMTMRATITPEPSMGLDNVGLPEEKALVTFRPFVTQKLVHMGYAKDALAAKDMLAKKGPKDKAVYRALDMVMEERPILLKRDPSLHKHSVQAFTAVRVPGKSIQIHPLVTSGYNADFDGDTMSVYVPVGHEAVKEAYNMMPSKNLFNEASGKVMYQPTNESSLGLYKMSRITGDSGKAFKDPTDLLRAVQSGKVGMTETAKVGGMKTTAGRVMIASSLPDSMHKKVLEDHSFVFDKKGTDHIYTELANKHKSDFGNFAVKLMNLGYGASFGVVKVQNPATAGTAFTVEKEGEHPKDHVQFLPFGTHSLGLDDFTPDKAVRDRAVSAAQKKIERIHRDPALSKSEKERRTVDAWFDATDKMVKEHTEKEKKNPNNLFLMGQAGIKPGPDQYQQLRLAPMMMTDSQNRVIPRPITKSYAEGLDLGSYWTQMSGARRGTVLKVQEVFVPGYFTKRLVNTSMGLVVASDDCGTHNGLSIPVSSKDVYDRVLAKDVTVKGHTFEKGTRITPDVVSTVRAADKSAQLLVRSPLKCEHEKGLCQKCAGIAPDGDYYKKGTNLGILATQSLGERATQLTLKAFHSGGLATRGPTMVNDIKRVIQLSELPRTIPNAARLATRSGKIEKIEQDATGAKVWIGGVSHHVPKDARGRPLWSPTPGTRPTIAGTNTVWSPPKVGMTVQAGQVLSDPSRTDINPHDLYKATGKIETVQNQMVNELHAIYGREGVRRQHVETMVKAMSNLTRVVDPGDADHVIKGEYQPTSKISALNKEFVKSGKKPVLHTPIIKGINVMPVMVQEDWMAKLNHNDLRASVAQSAAVGARSDLHGLNPIPGMAYGAEFGMGQRHVREKPHLRDVPEHVY